MKALAAFFVVVFFMACATAPVGQPGVAGTYDLVSYGTRSVPNADVGELQLRMTRQGSWQMQEEPGNRFGGNRGIFAAGDTVDGCIHLDLWPEVAPGTTVPMQVCQETSDWFGYLTPSWLTDLNLDGIMVFKKRQ